MKYQDTKADYLNRIHDFKKYLNQCIVCQEIGYDLDKIEERNEALFKERIKKLFHPLMLNEIGICAACNEKIEKK